MNKKLFSTLLLSLFFFTGSFSVSLGAQSAKLKIDQKFLQSVQSSSQEEIVIIKFRNPNAVEQAWNRAKAQHQTISNNYVITDFDETYIQSLSAFQKNWFETTSRTIPMTLLHTYQHVYNGIAVNVRGYYIPLLLQNPSVEHIYDTRDTNYLLREVEANTLSTKKTWSLVTKNKVNVTGKGIRVGILDTGIDYYHTDFSPMLYTQDKDGKQILNPLAKIKGGKDFADGDSDFMDSGNHVPRDPAGFPPHGTHVAGITSGNNPADPSKKGMAPDSELYVYKVFSDKGPGANPANIIAAANQSVIDKCHVINLSLGNSNPTSSIQPGEPYYDSLINAIKAGTVVVAAAGNDGSRSKITPYPIHAPGIFDQVIQVAGSDDRMNFGINIKYRDGSNIRINAIKFTYAPPFKTEFNGLPIIDCGFGREEDFAKVNVKGKIALISRGPKDAGITFQSKNLNAGKAGAIAAITYNYNEESLSGTLVQNPADQKLKFIPNLQLSGYHAGKLKEALADGGSIEFPAGSSLSIYDMSSAGPCYSGNDNVFKPEISAPGKQVNSAVMTILDEDPNSPTYNTYVPQYEDWDGTSMATPGATGAIALVRQARPDWSPVQVKNVVMNTADLIINQISNEPYSFFNQGSGQINALSAATAPIITSPPSFMQNIEKLTDGYSFEIQNVSEKAVTVNLSSQLLRLKAEQNPVEVKFNTTSLTIPAKGNLCFSVDFVIDNEQFTMRRVEGLIWIKIQNAKEVGSSSSSHHIPFILYKNKITDIDPPISNVTISENTIDSSSDNRYKVNFTLNTGSHTQIKGIEPELEYYSNIVYDFRVYIVDKKNNRWGDIYFSENIFVGDYSFEWNGKDLYGNDFVPDGKFFLVAESSGTKITVDGSTVTRDPMPDVSSPIPLTFVNSSVSMPPVFLIACPSKIKLGLDFTIDILFADVQNVDRFELELAFSKTNVSPIEYQLGDFIDPTKFDEKKDISFTKGNFSIKANRNPKITKGRVKVASLKLRADRVTSKLGMKFELLNLIIKNNENKMLKTITDYPVILIVNDQILSADFDGNSFIDSADLQLLMEAYPSSYIDDNWDAKFDLNNDYMVDISDIALFAQALEVELEE